MVTVGVVRSVWRHNLVFLIGLAVSDLREVGFEVDFLVGDIEFFPDSISNQIDRPDGEIRLFRNLL